MREKIQVDVRIFEKMCFLHRQISAFGRVLRLPIRRHANSQTRAGVEACPYRTCLVSGMQALVVNKCQC